MQTAYSAHYKCDTYRTEKNLRRATPSPLVCQTLTLGQVKLISSYCQILRETVKRDELRKGFITTQAEDSGKRRNQDSVCEYGIKDTLVNNRMEKQQPETQCNNLNGTEMNTESVEVWDHRPSVQEWTGEFRYAGSGKDT